AQPLWPLLCVPSSRLSRVPDSEPSSSAGPDCTSTGGGKGRDKHRVRKDPQGKRERQEERRRSGQQAEEREGRSGQSAAESGAEALQSQWS
ncbi:unnamed protein product, partial [Bubo scandiacus]